MRRESRTVAATWIAALAIAAGSGAGCSKSASRDDGAESPAARPPSACSEALREAGEAMAVAEPAARPALAAAAVEQLCLGLPKRVRSLLHLMASSPSDDCALIVEQLVTDYADVWRRACPGGPAAFAEAAAAAPADRAGIVVDRCALADGAALGTAAELRAADGLQLAFALLLHRFLLEGGVEPALARTLGRAAFGR